MSAIGAWSLMIWMAGFLLGMASVQENWVNFTGGLVLNFISFYALHRFGEPTP